MHTVKKQCADIRVEELVSNIAHLVPIHIDKQYLTDANDDTFNELYAMKIDNVDVTQFVFGKILLIQRFLIYCYFSAILLKCY